MNVPGPGSNVRVFLRVGPTDMRKQINGLAGIAAQRLKQNPLEQGTLFAFCNRRRDMIKLLYWERNGFCIWFKRLERDRFPWPSSEEEALEITSEQLTFILNGVNILGAHRPLEYSRIA